jgi:hypothetical protein
MERVFPIAPMNGAIRVMTVGLVLFGVVFLVAGLVTPQVRGPFFVTGGGFALLTVAVWLLWRPTHFIVRNGRLVLVYPARSKGVALSDFTDAEVLDGAGLRSRLGWALRVGVGGLFGGFGWLYTSQGWVEMDISRTDGLVLLSFTGRMPLLVTPDDPQAFVTAVREASAHR